jgi:hypothetical protein
MIRLSIQGAERSLPYNLHLTRTQVGPNVLIEFRTGKQNLYGATYLLLQGANYVSISFVFVSSIDLDFQC